MASGIGKLSAVGMAVIVLAILSSGCTTTAKHPSVASLQESHLNDSVESITAKCFMLRGNVSMRTTGISIYIKAYSANYSGLLTKPGGNLSIKIYNALMNPESGMHYMSSGLIKEISGDISRVGRFVTEDGSYQYQYRIDVPTESIDKSMVSGKNLINITDRQTDVSYQTAATIIDIVLSNGKDYYATLTPDDESSCTLIFYARSRSE